MIPDVTNHIRSAEAFMEAFRRCDPERDEEDSPDMALPAIVCAAFAAEVAIKALLIMHGRAERGHDLLDLITKLPSHLQLQIREGTCLAEDKFNRGIEDARHAFTEWRYFYESEDFLIVHLGFLGALTTVTLAIIDRIQNAV